MFYYNYMTFRLNALMAAAIASSVLAPAFCRASDIVYVTNSYAGVVSIIDGDRGTVVREVKVGVEPCDIALSPDKGTIAVSHEERLGEVWLMSRPDMGLRHRVLLTDAKNVRSNCFFLAFGADSKRLYAANQFSGMLFVIDAAQGKVVKEVRLRHSRNLSIECAAVSRDGARLYLGNRDGDELLVYDTARDRQLDPIRIEGGPLAIAVSPDGKRLYITNAGGTLDVMDLKTRAVIKKIPIGIQPEGVAVTKDGRFIFVTSKLSYYVSKIDAVLLKTDATIPVGSYPGGIALGADGKRVYVCNYNENTVSVIDASLARELMRVSTALSPVRAAVWSGP